MESQKLTVKLDTSEVVAGIRALCAPLAEIVQESARGQEKYGGEANDDSYTPFRWTQLIQDELHAARRASIHGAVSTKDDVRERMKRVAGLALSAMLAFDRAMKRAQVEAEVMQSVIEEADKMAAELFSIDPAAVADRALEGVHSGPKIQVTTMEGTQYFDGDVVVGGGNPCHHCGADPGEVCFKGCVTREPQA